MEHSSLNASKEEERATSIEEESPVNGYYYETSADGKTEVLGPYNAEEMIQMLREDRIKIRTLVKEGTDIKIMRPFYSFPELMKGMSDFM